MAILVDVIYKLLGIKIKHSAVSLEFIINSISPRYTHNSLLITTTQIDPGYYAQIKII